MAGLTHSGRGLLFGSPGLRPPVVREGRIAAQPGNSGTASMTGAQLPARVAGDHLFVFFGDSANLSGSDAAVTGWTKLEFDDLGPAVGGVYHRIATNDASDNFVCSRFAGAGGTYLVALYMLAVPPFGGSTFTTSIPQFAEQSASNTSPLADAVQPITAPATGFDLVVAVSMFHAYASFGGIFLIGDPTTPPGAFTLVPNSLDRDSYLVSGGSPEHNDVVGSAWIRSVAAGAFGYSSTSATVTTIGGVAPGGDYMGIFSFRMILSP